jgi:SAM-dependent methyltransferase
MTLEYTGERLVPEFAGGSTFWAHIYRYRFALQFVLGKSVLDIACGEGYGSAALSTRAKNVIGMDVSYEAIEHARSRYGLDARIGSAEAMPLPDASVDTVVSFETIEHLSSPPEFIRECHRVLRPEGQLVISTPNRDVYSGDHSQNPFHHTEMNEEEFAEVLRPHFTVTGWYGQCSTVGSWWRPRDLLVDGSPWLSFLGSRIARRALRLMLCRPILYEPSDELRNDPVGAVIKKDRMGAGFVNSYAVRNRRYKHPDCPRFLIAVATRNHSGSNASI